MAAWLPLWLPAPDRRLAPGHGLSNARGRKAGAARRGQALTADEDRRRGYVLFLAPAPAAARSTLGVFLAEPTPDFGRYGRIDSIAPLSALDNILRLCRRCANASGGGS